MDLYKLKKSSYDILNWKEKFPDYKINLRSLPINETWKPFFDLPEVKENLDIISEYLSHCLTATKGEVNIFPYPDLVFAALNELPLNKIKVVILGQDPYYNYEMYGDKIIPQAMGLSFSVPKGITIPPSLANIYKNLKKYSHVYKEPSHGNLAFWAYQGCLLLNTILTVQEKCPKGHEIYWKEITNSLIKYISDNTKNVVFLLWGDPAYKKIQLIDAQKHKIIVSSHPSPLSYTTKLKQFESFENTNHFGEANIYLRENTNSTILWEII